MKIRQRDGRAGTADAGALGAPASPAKGGKANKPDGGKGEGGGLGDEDALQHFCGTVFKELESADRRKGTARQAGPEREIAHAVDFQRGEVDCRAAG